MTQVFINTKHIYLALNPSWKAFDIGMDTRFKRFVIRIGHPILMIGENPNYGGGI